MLTLLLDRGRSTVHPNGLASLAGLALVAGGSYRLDRLPWPNGGFCVSAVIVSLGRLRLARLGVDDDRDVDVYGSVTLEE